MQVCCAVLFVCVGAQANFDAQGSRSLSVVQIEAVAAHLSSDQVALTTIRAELDHWSPAEQRLTATANAILISEWLDDEPGYVERVVRLCQWEIRDATEAGRRKELIDAILARARDGEELQRSIRAADAATRQWTGFVDGAAMTVLQRALRANAFYRKRLELTESMRGAVARTSGQTCDLDEDYRAVLEASLEELDWLEAQCHYDALEYRPLWGLTQQYLSRYGRDGRYSRKLFDAASKVTEVRQERGLEVNYQDLPAEEWLDKWEQEFAAAPAPVSAADISAVQPAAAQAQSVKGVAHDAVVPSADSDRPEQGRSPEFVRDPLPPSAGVTHDTKAHGESDASIRQGRRIFVVSIFAVLMVAGALIWWGIKR